MGDFVHSKDVPKKYYRYFLKGLAYYTCYLNKACTLADLQAYVFLKSLQHLSEADLTSLTQEVMGQLISTRLAYNQNGYYRLNELLRFAHGSKQIETIDHTRDTELSTGSGMRKMVNFSKTVTMWPTDTSSAVNDPSPFLNESFSAMDEDNITSPTNNTDTDHHSDSDEDDEGNHGKKAETNPSASQVNPDKDSDSNRTKDTDDDDDDDEDDEDSGISQTPVKPEPDQEPNNPKSEDDTQKQE